MPKMKTHRGAAKRFRYTGGGRIRRAKAYKSHLLAKKPSRRKRRLRHLVLVNPSDQRHVRRLLPYG
ncbi:MAG: 50S ribosomal protein L35 [Moorellales bacterium]|jgi:large subunit ribosomal protein L35